MYRWIRKHKLISIILILLIPITAELALAFFDRILRWQGISLNFLGLYLSDRYAFIGSYLGGFATLIAVVITIDDAKLEQKIQKKEEAAPMLVLQPITDRLNLEKIGMGLEQMNIILTEKDARFKNSLSADVPCVNGYYLTNFGKGAAINTVTTLRQEDGGTYRNNQIVSLLPNEKMILKIGTDLPPGRKAAYLIEMICRNVYGDGYKFTFAIWIERNPESEKYEVSTRLYSEREELPRLQNMRSTE